MKEYIRNWIASHKIQSVLGIKSVSSNGLTYDVYEFWAVDGKYYVCSFIYDDHRIWPYTGKEELLKLSEGFSPTTSNSELEEEDFESVLSRSRVHYDSHPEWVKNRPKKLTEQQMKAVLDKRYAGIEESLRKESFVEFSVVNVEMKDSSVVIYFTKSGNLQLPLKLQLGEPSLVKRRNYGEMTSMFEEFVERLGDILDGIYWR